MEAYSVRIGHRRSYEGRDSGGWEWDSIVAADQGSQ